MTWHLTVYDALVQDYAGQLGVVVIPTNHFNMQEPGTNPEIPMCYQWVRPGGDFLPTFDLAAKHEINGFAEDPLYTYLKGACHHPKEEIGAPDSFYFTPIKVHDITWNFEKFLVDTDGKVVTRYEPSYDPDRLRADIDAILAGAKLNKVQKVAKKASKRHPK